MLLTIPMEHLNSPAFFIIFEHLHTIQTDSIRYKKCILLTVLPLFQYHQFNRPNILHHHAGFIEPFEPLFFHLSIHPGECLHRQCSCICSETNPFLINSNESIGLRLRHPGETSISNEISYLLRRLQLIEHDHRRSHLHKRLP